jgi:mono/diheme cytochrome c family protein
MNSLKVVMVFLAALLLAACQQPAANNGNTLVNVNAAPQSSPQPTATLDVAAQGKEIFATNCQICHKEDGTGGPVTIDGKKLNPDNLTTDKMKAMSDEKLIGYVTNGVVDEGMPAFKDKLSPEEIRMVVNHVRTLQAK